MNYINFQQLQSKLGNRSRSAIYVDLETGRLPHPIKMGRRSYWMSIKSISTSKTFRTITMTIHESPPPTLAIYRLNPSI